MAVNLKNPDAERLLYELAEATGESLTEAAARAFSERLERLKRQKEAVQQRQRRALLELVEEARRQKLQHDDRPLKEITDELWGDST
ncbi:MAG: type II toxin-antitoxin system VapB family antitoxin [Myxococcota bacterium]